jgi:hypothetical protein
MYGWTAPFLSWPGWESIWENNDNKNRAFIRRLAEHKEIWETHQATEFEAMIYLSTATLSFPPSHHWTQVYMYLFRRWYGAKEADETGITGPDELDSTAKDMLSHLRNWIFRQQLNHMKAKLRGETPAVKKEQKKLEAEQRQLF